MVARPNARTHPVAGHPDIATGRRVPVKVASTQWTPYAPTPEEDAAELKEMCDASLRQTVRGTEVSVKERLRVERALRVGPVLEDLPAA